MKSIKISTLRKIFLAVLTLTICATPVSGQTAQLSGVVQDASGAYIVDASITAKNLQTGLTRTSSSSAAGFYSLPLLPPGQYVVTASKEGFKTVARTGVNLAVDDTARLDFSLDVGALSQSVEVTADTTMVNTESGTLKQVINQKQILDLPLNGRNAGELVFLTAGAIRDTRTAGTYVYGSSIVPDTPTPSINGARSNGVAFRLDGANNNDNYTGIANPFPNPDALQEFSIQTNSFSAEFGNAPGGVVNIRTKSGTNSLHGSVFNFLRNGAMNARDFFAARRDNLKRNQFGATLGGSVVKNKIFFFGSYQGTRVRATNGGLSQFVFTDAMRLGDFSSVAGRLVDPTTGQDFPNRRIPAGRMDPVALKLLEYMPRSQDTRGQLFYSLPSRTDSDEFLLKSDQNWRNHQFYQRYYQYDLEQPSLYPDPKVLTQFSDGRRIRVQTFAANDVFMITPGLLNTFTVTATHNRGGTIPAAPFGVPDLGARLAQPEVPSLAVSISGFAGFNTSHLARITRDNLEFTDNLNWFRGKHQVIAGTSILRLRQDIVNDFRKNGSFSFTNDITGNAAANFLLGLVTTFQQGGGEYKALRGWRLNYYIQDNYRVSSSLQLNLGLRLDPWIPYTDELDRITCIVPGAKSSRFANAPAGLLYAGDQGCERGGTSTQFWKWAPRLGFAWSPGGGNRWSIRGGVGVFYEQPETVLYNRFVNTAPFSPNFLLSGVPFSDPYRNATNPFPAKYGPRNPPTNENFETPILATTFDRGFKPQYMQNWNLSVERQIGADSVARLAYVGSKGTNLRTNIESNPAVYAPGATVGNTQQRRLNPTFSSIVMSLSGGNSNYNALQATFERRFSKGLSAMANYTYSKSIDYSSVNTTQGGSNVPNPFNIRAYRGPSDFDVRHKLLVSPVYSLPELRNASSLVRAVAGGWQLSGIWSWQGGFPFSVTSGVDNSRSGIGADLADYNGGEAEISGRVQDKLNRYFNVGAFQANALGTFGSAGRNILRGPRRFNIDGSVQKVLPVTEQVRLQIRGEAFNLTNTPGFGMPGSVLSSPAVGRITSAASARIMQVALKVTF